MGAAGYLGNASKRNDSRREATLGSLRLFFCTSTSGQNSGHMGFRVLLRRVEGKPKGKTPVLRAPLL